MRAARSGFVLLFLAVGCTKFVPSVPVIELVSIPAGSFVMGSLGFCSFGALFPVAETAL